jgi:hypothetical protein
MEKNKTLDVPEFNAHEVMIGLSRVAHDLCCLHDISCCEEQPRKHLNFKCKYSSQLLIASYLIMNLYYVHWHGVSRTICYLFMGSIEVNTYIDKLAKTCTMTWIMQSKFDYIFEICMKFLGRSYDSQVEEINCSTFWYKKRLSNPWGAEGIG